MSANKHAVELMNFAHGMLTKTIDLIPADKATYQPHPTSNHVIWTLGHLAATYNWLASTIDASKAPALPESFSALFGPASKPNPEKDKYPSLAEVRRHFDAAFAAYLEQVQGLSDADAWTPGAVDTGGFASSKLDAAYKCAWHDGWHLGQVMDIKRALQLPSVF